MFIMLVCMLTEEAVIIRIRVIASNVRRAMSRWLFLVKRIIVDIINIRISNLVKFIRTENINSIYDLQDHCLDC
jgi:hypothetical protein